jgi:hypothetical protein
VLKLADGNKQKGFKMYKYILIFLSIFALTACDDRYRYPCQDPKNKNNPECTQLICEQTRECPKI